MSVLQSPVGVQLTEWSVLTGAPSAGKTAVIRELQHRSVRCLPEAAEIYIGSRLQLGELLPEICKDKMHLQRSIFQQALVQEQTIATDEHHVFDRSAADALAYCRLYGIDDMYFRDNLKFRYKHVLQLDRLPLRRNKFRIEDETSAQLLDQYLEQVYRELGYNVIRVPVMSVRNRVSFILDHTL